MNKTTVKICGLQTEDAVQTLNELHVDQVGFVFAKSRRQVSAERASQLMQLLQKNSTNTPLTVGVFVNPTQEELIGVMQKAPLDVIQLHGNETAAFCRWVKEELQAKVYKVVSILAAKDADAIQPIDDKAVAAQLAPYAGVIDALMLDTYDPIVGGGTGEPFAWEHIPLYRDWTRLHQVSLLIAGGLNVSNVRGLIQQYEPDGVDVSSGVETDGVKDHIKIKQFVERVKSNDAR